MDKIKKIVLVNPMYKRPGYYGGLHSGYQPLALGVLATLTPKDIEIILIDEKFENYDEAIKKIQNVDIVGITGFTTNITRGYEIAKKTKENGIPVIMGGVHVSFMPEEALKYCDSVVIGEAEGLWEQVLADAEQGSLKKTYVHNGNIEDIKPRAARRDIFDKYDYAIGGLQTARGCPMNCDFCSVTAYNGFKYRKRDIDDVINELKQIKQKEILVFDDNIIGRTKEQKEHSLNLFKRIVKEKINKLWVCQSSLNVAEDEELLKWMYKSGCRIMLVGIESVDKDNLRAMNKAYNLSAYERYAELINRIHKNGMALIGSFIIGYPNDGMHTVKAISDFINDFKIDVFVISHLTPLPGPGFFKKCKMKTGY